VYQCGRIGWYRVLKAPQLLSAAVTKPAAGIFQRDWVLRNIYKCSGPYTPEPSLMAEEVNLSNSIWSFGEYVDWITLQEQGGERKRKL